MSQLRIAARTLARSRGFSTVATLSLGLAIALNVVIYSLLVALIDPVIDVRQPEQLHRFRYFGDVHHRLPLGAVEDALRSGVTSFDGVTGARSLAIGRESTIEAHGVVRDVLPLVARPNVFQVLGTRPLVGRTFQAMDSASGAAVAVISDRIAGVLAVNGRAPVGDVVTVDGMRYTVIGVVPRLTVFPGLDTDVWLLPAGGAMRANEARPVPLTLIRLRDNASPALVQNQLDLLARRLALAAGESPRDTRFFLTADKAERQFHLGYFHWALIDAVLAVLFVACGNLANLQLARGLARGPELAVRSALGATRRDLVTTLVLENALLAGAGLVLGLVLSLWGIDLVRSTIPHAIASFLVEPHVSWGMFVAALAAAMASLVVVGLLPALRIARVDANSLLKSRAGTGAHRGHRRRYAILVAIQLGVSLPILCGAVLLARSSWRVRNGDFIERSWIGFNPDPVVEATVTVNAPAGSWVRLTDLSSDLVGRLRALPSVAEASIVAGIAPSGRVLMVENNFGEMREVPAPGWSAQVVTPSYFRAMGRTMAAGQDFVDGGYAASEVVMDEPTARFLWPGVNPIGRLIKFGDAASDAPLARVVGTVRDMRDTTTLRYLDPDNGFKPEAIFRVMTPGDSVLVGPGGLTLTVEARTKRDADVTAVDVRHLLWATPGVGNSYVRTLDDRYGLVVSRQRDWFVTVIFTLFATIGTGLVALGIFGIVAHSVTERRQEFGVRISLGATRGHILRDVLRGGRLVALAGAALGLYWTKGAVGSLAFFLNGQWDMNDALLFAAIAAVLAATATAAALIPALRATRIDPVEAMRAE
ncbi:MAG TPA: ABC transporter permease [Gemmatimonadaceae bacterium]|nr:ABC transporter permease [Gemmatimonadaceae bacterium]